MDREIPIKERKKQRNKRLLRLVVIAGLTSSVIWCLYCFLRTEVSRESLKIATVDCGDIEPSVVASGIVAPSIEEMVICPINSQVLEILHHSGDEVEEGTPLLRLDTQSAHTEYQLQYDKLQMQQSQLQRLKINNKTYLDDLAMKIKVAAMQLDRFEAELRNECYLDSLGSGTHDKVKEAEFTVETSRLELEQLHKQIENERKIKTADEHEKQLEVNIATRDLGEIKRTLVDAQIRSPRRAVLTYIIDEVGAQVTKGSKIAVVSDLSHFKVNCKIADVYGEHIGAGGKVLVKVGSVNLEGFVNNVTPLSKDGVISFTVKLDEDNHPRLRSGLKTDVYVINSLKENVMRLPNASFYSGAGIYSLFVVENGDKLVRREVKLGECSFDYVEVIEGLAQGEQVVVSDMKQYKSQNSIKLK